MNSTSELYDADRAADENESAVLADTLRPNPRPLERSLRFDLEGLRAIAVLGVVVYHLKSAWLPGGFAGVDVFFVLSGFFITSLLLREAATTARIDLLAFWGRRARRLLPGAAVVLIGTIVAGQVFVDAFDSRRFAQDGLWTALFSVNWRYAFQGTSYLADPSPSPLTHFWSLGVEEQFYLVWPVLLLGVVILVGRYRPRWLRVAVGAVALVASITSFLIAWQQTYGLQPFAYFATYARVWQLGLGAALAAFAVALGRLPLMLRTPARWAGVGTILGFYVLAPIHIAYPGWIAAIPTLGAVLIVISGLPSADGRTVSGSADPVLGMLRSRVSQLLGRYSYGWYLWHWPPLVLLPLYLHHALSDWELVGCAMIALACAIVSYHVLEHPVRSSRALARRHGGLSLALGATLIVAACGTAQTVAVRADHITRSTTIRTAHRVVLHPSPGQAAAEQNQAAADGCEIDQTIHENAPECRYLPDSGKGDIILVGDSHAAQWLPAVKTVGTAHGWGLRVWTRENCPFADVTKIINGSPNGACDDWRSNVLKRIIAAKPSLVVVSSYPPPGGPSVYDRASSSKVTGTAAAEVYRAGMRRELAKLSAAGIPTLLIEDPPRFRQAAPECVLTHQNDLPACSAPEAVAQHSTIDRQAAAAVPGVHTLDLTSVFCSAGRCYQVVGSDIAYRDNNHLSHEMITQLTPRVQAAMEAASS